MKYQFKASHDKVKQYLLRKFDNPTDIIIVVRDIKDTYAHFGMDKPSKLNK